MARTGGHGVAAADRCALSRNNEPMSESRERTRKVAAPGRKSASRDRKYLTNEERSRRDTLIMQMFLSGWSYKDIGRHSHVNLTYARVHAIVTKALNDSASRQALLQDKALAIYVERMEALMKATWPQAMQGDLKAVEMSRRLLEQMGRLYDLEEEGKVSGAVLPSDAELEDEDADELAEYRKRHRPPASG